jgi:hypothetical protein
VKFDQMPHAINSFVRSPRLVRHATAYRCPGPTTKS